MRPILITAGATRNPVDAIRYLSATSSGRTGVHLARNLEVAGHVVYVLGSPEACMRAQDLDHEEFGSTRDLLDRVRTWVGAHPNTVVVHAAAVGDYEASPESSKIPSGHKELVLRLRPAPKILDQIRTWSPDVRIVSFKAAAPETDDEGLVRIARRQLHRTGSSLVFANVLGRLDRGIALVSADGATWYETRAEAMAALEGHVAQLAAERGER